MRRAAAAPPRPRPRRGCRGAFPGRASHPPWGARCCLSLTPAAAARAAWLAPPRRARLSCAQLRDALRLIQCELTPALRGRASNQQGMNNFHQTFLYFMSRLCRVVCRKIHLMNTALGREAGGKRAAGQTPGAGPQPRMRRVCRRPRRRHTGRHAPPVRSGVMTGLLWQAPRHDRICSGQSRLGVRPSPPLPGTLRVPGARGPPCLARPGRVGPDGPRGRAWASARSALCCRDSRPPPGPS